ncbi:unnamed protein product, partial [Prorocentrum cordatum]
FSRLGRATPRSRRGGLKNSWGEAAFEGPLRHGKTNATLDAPLEGHEGGAYIAQGGEHCTPGRRRSPRPRRGSPAGAQQAPAPGAARPCRRLGAPPCPTAGHHGPRRRPAPRRRSVRLPRLAPEAGARVLPEVQSGGARAAGRNPWSRRWRGRSEVQVGRLRRLAARHLSCAHTLKGSKPRVYSKLHSLNAKMLSKKSYAVKSPPVLS